MQILNKSLTKYLLIGGLAFAIEYGTFYILYIGLHIGLVIANSFSFILALLTSFTLNRLWTFGYQEYNKKAAHQLSFYVVLASINFILTNLIVEGLAALSLNPKIGKLIAMITTSLWNYILFKIIIFTHKESAS